MRKMRNISYKDQFILTSYLKFDENALKKMKSLINKSKGENFILKEINQVKKKPIPESIIKTFYEQPSIFFKNYKNLLEQYSPFDDAGISIFDHYFYVLYEYKRYEDTYINNNNFQFDVYESNFESFFKEEGKYLPIQDLSLETPLHKLAKLRDKKFFLEICQKLKNINLLNDELLSINDINFKTCFDYIVEDIENKSNIIIKNDFEIYNNFIKDYHSLFLKLPEIPKISLNYFSLKVIEKEIFKEKDFKVAYSYVNNLLQNCEEKKSILECLFYSHCNINYINYLFCICKENSEYNELIKFIAEALDKNNNENDKQISAFHITYVLRNINLNEKKGENEFYYATKLLNDILPLILKGKTYNEINNILADKIITHNNYNLLEIGLVN